MKNGDILCLENTRFHPGEERERSALRRGARRARRHLGQRRLLGRPPRPCLDRGPRPRAARLCRPHHGGRARRPRQGAGSAAAPGGRRRRRRQGVDQARSPGQPRRQGRRADHRRRHGQYVSSRHRALRSGTSLCEHDLADTALRHPRHRQGAALRGGAAGRCHRRQGVQGRSAVARGRDRCGRRRRDDPRHRPAHRRARDLGAGAGARRWSGTARSARSSWNRSTSAPSRWRRRRPN